MMIVGKGTQKGLSLIEVMVALTISLILLAGIVQIFSANTRASRLVEGTARIQENGRIAVELMNRAVRNADYWGCAGSLDNVSNNLNPAGTGYVTEIHGYGDGIGGQDNVASVTIGGKAVLDGTDIFTVRGAMGDDSLRVSTPPAMNNTSAVVHINDSSSFADGDIVLISDCVGGDIFQITNVQPTNNNLVHNTGATQNPGNYNPAACGGGGNAHCLSKTYNDSATIFRPYYETYFIALGSSGEPALHMQDTTNTVYELVEGVQDMQILYGEDTSGDQSVNRYAVASAVTDMDDVISIRVSFLVRSSQQNVLDSEQVINFNGTAVAGTSDRRLRRIYNNTTTIRNRM